MIIMAVKKGTLKRKNGAGTYDEINLKTTAEQVKMTDGTTVQAFLDTLPTGGGAGAKVVADITARDALTSEEGLIAYVVDATGDSTVKSGGASYIYDGSNWIKYLNLKVWMFWLTGRIFRTSLILLISKYRQQSRQEKRRETSG